MVKVTMAQKKAAIAEKAKADKEAKYKAFADACKECEAILNHPATMADTLTYIELKKKIEKESARAEEMELLKLSMKQGFYPYAEWENDEGNYVACCCVDKCPFSVLPCTKACCKPNWVCHYKPLCSCKCNCCKCNCCESNDKPYGFEIIGCFHCYCAKWPVCLSCCCTAEVMDEKGIIYKAKTAPASVAIERT